MTQEEKQLLLKDLCARLPYGVICLISNYSASITKELKIGGLEAFEIGSLEVKPYLRPMSSMTEEELEEFRTLILPEASCAYEDCLEWDAQIISGGYLQISVEDFSKVMNWLNAHHFDYRSLIEKGLALDCTNLNIY